MLSWVFWLQNFACSFVFMPLWWFYFDFFILVLGGGLCMHGFQKSSMCDTHIFHSLISADMFYSPNTIFRDKTQYIKHAIRYQKRTRPGLMFFFSMRSSRFWHVLTCLLVIFSFLLLSLLPSPIFKIYFSQLMTKLPGVHPAPHLEQLGHFDIDFLIDQPALNIDILEYLNFSSYRQHLCDHVDVLIFLCGHN